MKKLLWWIVAIGIVFYITILLIFVPSKKNTVINTPQASSKTVTNVGPLITATSTKEVVKKVSISQEVSPTKVVDGISAADIFAMVNQIRTANGLSALKYNEELQTAAQEKSDDMAKRGYFSHINPEGSYVWPLIAESGYNGAYRGENLAEGFSDANDLVTAWKESPEHLQNILGIHYIDTGIGLSQGMYLGKETVFVVQLFANPK